MRKHTTQQQDENKAKHTAIINSLAFSIKRNEDLKKENDSISSEILHKNEKITGLDDKIDKLTVILEQKEIYKEELDSEIIEKEIIIDRKEKEFNIQEWLNYDKIMKLEGKINHIKKEYINKEIWIEDKLNSSKSNLEAQEKILYQIKDEIKKYKKDLTNIQESINSEEHIYTSLVWDINENYIKLENIKQDIINQKIDKELLNQETRSILNNIEQFKKNDIELDKKLKSKRKEIIDNQDELNKIRETNIILIKKEEKLNQLTTKVKELYKKVGLNISI